MPQPLVTHCRMCGERIAELRDEPLHPAFRDHYSSRRPRSGKVQIHPVRVAEDFWELREELRDRQLEIDARRRAYAAAALHQEGAIEGL